jgi:hypothetical protein
MKILRCLKRYVSNNKIFLYKTGQNAISSRLFNSGDTAVVPKWLKGRVI